MRTTTIQVKSDTIGRLKFFKDFSKESYDEIINKMIDKLEEDEMTEDAIEGIKQGLKDARAGRVTPIEDIAKEMGIKLN